jgi:multisubunit Na+/H+ antiporter MnhB subunit
MRTFSGGCTQGERPLDDAREIAPPRWLRLLAALGAFVLTAALVGAILDLPAEAPGLYREVDHRLSESGVESMVTAVLLNFRAYDTLLELTVLLVAVLGLGAIRLGSREPLPPVTEINPVLMAFVRFLSPVMILLAGYLLWAGGSYAGGAFQAGAVLGATAILLQIAGIVRVGQYRLGTEKTALVLGVFLFAGIGIACMVLGGAFLQYPPSQAKQLILLIEAAGAFSIGATLMVLFSGRSLADPRDGETDAPSPDGKGAP